MPLDFLPKLRLGRGREDGGEHESMLSSPSARCLPLVFALLPLRAAQPPPLVELLEVLRQHPDNPGAHNNVGLALKAAGDLQGAVRHLEKAIELNPEYARGYNSLGNALQASARSGGPRKKRPFVSRSPRHHPR